MGKKASGRFWEFISNRISCCSSNRNFVTGVKRRSTHAANGDLMKVKNCNITSTVRVLSEFILQRRSVAFTLIEFLVAIAIIATLDAGQVTVGWTKQGMDAGLREPGDFCGAELSIPSSVRASPSCAGMDKEQTKTQPQPCPRTNS